jgi:hypothetical protein
VRTFKAKFGGDLVCYGRNVRAHAPWRLALSRIGYRVYQRVVELRAGAVDTPDATWKAVTRPSSRIGAGPPGADREHRDG